MIETHGVTLTLAAPPARQKVIAFEIRKLAPYWEEKMKEYPNIDIVWGNVLTQFQKNLNSKFQIPDSRYKILANLPYHITSDALRVMLELDPKPAKIVVMVQKEVAERICAKPPRMSLLSVAVQYYGEPRIVARVPAGAFWPRPKVDSAVVAITPQHPSTQAPEHLVETEHFFRVVRAGFSQKRKQLWHNLSAGLQLDPINVKAVLKEVAGNEKIRAEELTVEQWKQVLRCWGAQVLK